MYTLSEAWIKMHGCYPIEDWDGRLYCTETDAAITLRTNETHGYMAAYTFTLVLEGWVTLVFGGRELTLEPGDLYVYSPGMSVTVVAASADYRGICLLADERTTFDVPTVHDLVHIAYLPIVQLHQPILTLDHDDALLLRDKMREIARHLHSQHIYKGEVLRMLYAVFLLELQDAQGRAIARRVVSQRVEDIFVSFLRLLPRHFAQHHDIGFYASELSISPVYLSRVVRQVSGRTVMDYVNEMLVMEGSYLLRTSGLSIAQISDRLHFSDATSFTRFFTRMKGVNPRAFRESKN